MIDIAESNEVVTKKITIESGSVQGAAASFTFLTSSGMLDPVRGGGVALMRFDGAAVGAGATTFLGRVAAAAVADAWMKCPVSGTAVRLDLVAGAPPGVGQSYTYTLENGSSDTAITMQITGPAAFQAFSTGAVAIAAGDLLSVKLVTSAGATVQHHCGHLAIQTSGV